MTKKKNPLLLEQEATVHKYLKDHAKELLAGHNSKRAASEVKTLAKNQLFLNELEVLLKKYPFPKNNSFKSKKDVKTKRVLNLMLSDLHYGSDLIPEETGHKYGPVEEARRTAMVVKTAAEWKRQYRSETTLNVHLLGDIIQGKLHDVESAAPLTAQFHRAVWNLRQAIAYLATEFKHVHVRCVPGNHGRRKDRHPDRAVNQKWDSIENMIYAALKFSLADLPNVKIEIPLRPFYLYDSFGQKGFMTHGDTVLNVGYPNKAIQVQSVRRQINEINNIEHAHLYGVGHVHVASTTRLPNNIVLITNGCLIPSDDYAQSIGIMETACTQQIWESVPGIILGHRMDILIDSQTDKNAELDKIIKPFPGMFEFGLADGVK
jgi:hypothetical protein